MPTHVEHVASDVANVECHFCEISSLWDVIVNDLITHARRTTNAGSGQNIAE